MLFIGESDDVDRAVLLKRQWLFKENKMLVTGGCLCQSVRYEITAEAITTRICWCRLCQYIGGGSATVNACFSKEAITIHGETADFVGVADSGNIMHRRFCPKCGTPLFSEAEARPHLIFVRVGTLDNPEVVKPATSIWTSQAPSWACIDDTIPRLAVQAAPAG